MPYAPRTTVCGVTDQAKPSRGAQLLRSGSTSARSSSEPSRAWSIVSVSGSKLVSWLSFSQCGVAYS